MGSAQMLSTGALIIRGPFALLTKFGNVLNGEGGDIHLANSRVGRTSVGAGNKPCTVDGNLNAAVEVSEQARLDLITAYISPGIAFPNSSLMP